MALIGVILIVQGGGGLINNLFTDSDSWFALNYLELSRPVTVLGHALLLAAGLLLAARRKGWRRLFDD